MKKVLLSMLMIFSAVFMGSQIFADEAATGKGNVVIHYQNTSGDYSDIGLNSWGHGDKVINGVQNPKALEGITETDGFGVYWELKDVEVSSEGNFGFQVVGFDNPEDANPNWDNKKYTNHEIQKSDLVAGKTVHIYMFIGSNTRTNNEGLDKPIPYLVSNPEEHNALVSYYDQSGAYAENLGAHHWNFSNAGNAEWGSPDKVFKVIGKDKVGTDILGYMFNYEEGKTPGFLIYAGGDANKKTGDVRFENFEDLSAVGEVDVIQIYNAGDANVSNENVHLNDGAKYIEEAYSFGFVGLYVDDSGMLAGTFAPTPNQIMVEFNSDVKAPKFEGEDAEGLTEEQRQEFLTKRIAAVKAWFSVKDASGKTVAITDINFNTGAASLSSFVLILGSDLDNTKEYTLRANISEDQDIETIVDTDKEAPVFTFLSPSDFQTEKDGDKRIILVAWDKKFDQNLFPRFTVRDNRDGDITSLVHVPKGDFSKINTNIIGDYKIMLRVSDDWGNVTEETFIFRVTKKVK